MPEVDLIDVEGEDLALRVALLDLEGEQGFLDLALGRLLPADGKEVAGELLGQRAGASPLPGEQVLQRGDQDARRAQAEMLVEARVLGGDDRLIAARRAGATSS